VLAWDGLTLHQPEATQVVMLSSGNRVEFLVKAGAPGSYDLVLTPGSSQKPSIPGMPDENKPSLAPREAARYSAALGFPNLKNELDPRPILTLNVTGSGPSMSLPTSLPAYDPPIHPIARTRRLEYTVQREGLEFMDFGINGHKYDPARAPYQPVLGTAEEWTLVNAPDPKLMEHAHVFHIHVNPFKVTHVNGKALSTPLWRDTWVLTKLDGDSFTFQTNFDDFTGKFVEHCHVLSHEDLGMMEAIEVVPPMGTTTT
jgi:FtsP/CotA-like multicopper oxidase with cupredoxin domain